MGRLRRRRRKYTWFPQIGFQGETVEDDSVTLPVAIPTALLDGTLSNITVFPIIPDAPNDTPATGADHLDDFIASEYFIKRIVGRFQFCMDAISDQTNPAATACVVAAGFFIARADESTPTFPIGCSTPGDAKANYGPLNLANTREPWIWRRTWVCSPPIINNSTGALTWNTNVGGATGNSFPPNNCHGSVAEGSIIDARTARRVGNDERLYFAVQTMVGEAIGVVTNQTQVFPQGYLDVRILGALRRARNRSTF